MALRPNLLLTVHINTLYILRNTIGGQFSDTKIAFVPCLRAHVKGCYRSTNEEFYSRWVASAAHCMSLSNPPLPANQVSVKHKLFQA